MTIDAAAIGPPVQVFHRLALGVEPVDAFTRGLIGPGVRVGREAAGAGARRWRQGAGPLDPLEQRVDEPLETNGTGRFKLRHRAGIGATVTVRVDDPYRRYVPRRFTVPLWTLAEVEAADADPPAGTYVPVRSRLLRPWLLPGSAYQAPRGTTGVRGRVVRAGDPVRWPRVEALGPGGLVVGIAHGDDRGEFVLLLTGTGSMAPPAPSMLDVQLVLRAAPPPPAWAPPPLDVDPLADLPLEPVTRSSVPPLPSDLDNPLLRGQAVPAGYATSTTPPPTVTVTVGRVLAAAAPFPFTP